MSKVKIAYEWQGRYYEDTVSNKYYLWLCRLVEVRIIKQRFATSGRVPLTTG